MAPRTRRSARKTDSQLVTTVRSRGPRLRFADDRLFFWLTFAPTAAITIVVIIVPIVYTFGLSFFSQNTLIASWTFAGAENYWELGRTPLFWQAFWNGLIYTVGSTVLSTIAGIAVALLLNEPFLGRGAMRALVIFPYIVPAIVVTFIWKFMFNSRGVVNDLLRELGVVATFIPWLGDQRFAMAAVIVISAWAWFPFAAITLLAALQNIPDTIFEAAVIDGAGPWRRFWYLTLPLLLPALIVVVLIRSIWAFRNFDMIWLLTGGGPINSTYVLPIMAYQEAFGTFRMGYAAAVASSLMLFMTVLAGAYFRAYTLSRRSVAA